MLTTHNSIYTKTLNAIVVLSVVILAACASPKDLVYQDVKNFRVSKISLRPEVGMDVQFYNPNKYGMTLKDANVDLYINNKLAGHAMLTEKFQVPASSTFLLPVTLVADLKNILPNAMSLLANEEVNIRLTGNVKAGKGIMVNIPIQYEGKKKLNVFQ
jgi:LEA14-like dessication related protein